MKELSIEEKARAYDEALERARNWKEKSGMPKDRQGILDDIFPELKESEDERIKKEILDYIIKGSESSYDVQQYGKETFEKWIAWLEKQGKNNIGISEATKKELEDNLNKALEKETSESWNGFLDEKKPYGQRQECSNCQMNYAGLCKGSCTMKRGEQKPIEYANGDDYGIDGLWHAINILENTLGKVQGYQTDDGILEHKCAISAVKKLYEKKPIGLTD